MSNKSYSENEVIIGTFQLTNTQKLKNKYTDDYGNEVEIAPKGYLFHTAHQFSCEVRSNTLVCMRCNQKFTPPYKIHQGCRVTQSSIESGFHGYSFIYSYDLGNPTTLNKERYGEINRK